jgi:hypothetical protein
VLRYKLWSSLRHRSVEMECVLDFAAMVCASRQSCERFIMTVLRTRYELSNGTEQHQKKKSANAATSSE